MIHEGRRVVSLSFWQLLRYSSFGQKLFLVFGWTVSIVAGIAIPLLNINFGHMIDVYVKYDTLSNFPHDNQTTGNGTDRIPLGNTTHKCDDDRRDFRERSYAIAFNILAVGFVYFFLCYFFSIILDKVACKIMYRTKVVFYECLLKQETSWADESSAIDFAQGMEADMMKMEEGIGSKTGLCLYMLSTSICSLMTAVYFGWELTFVLLALTPVFGLVSSVLTKVHLKRQGKCQEVSAEADFVGAEIIAMIKFIFSFGGETKQLLRHEKVLDDEFKSHVSTAVTSSLYNGLVWLSNYLTYALGVWYGSKLIIVSRETETMQYTVGDIIIIFWNVLSITYFAGRTGTFLSILEEAKTSGRRVFQFIDRESLSHARGMRPNDFQPSIRFDKVFFKHDWESLKGITFHVKEGQRTAIVGRPGSGVGVIGKLLMRFYEQDSGDIYVGDMDVESLNLEWLRFNLGFVGRNPIVFDGTIHDNIWMANKTSVRSDIIHAVRVSNCNEFVMTLSDDQMQAVIGSKGMKLTTGQKQRIAIAKAVLRQSKIVIFDRVMSLIPPSEVTDVEIGIERSQANKTSIIISESISDIIKNSDHILVMQDGLIKEEGSYNELISRHGLFKQMLVEQNDKSRSYQVSPSFLPKRQSLEEEEKELQEEKDADDCAKRRGDQRERTRETVTSNENKENPSLNRQEEEEKDPEGDQGEKGGEKQEEIQALPDFSSSQPLSLDSQTRISFPAILPRSLEYHNEKYQKEEKVEKGSGKRSSPGLNSPVSSKLPLSYTLKKEEECGREDEYSYSSSSNEEDSEEEHDDNEWKRGKKGSFSVFSHKYSFYRITRMIDTDMALVVAGGLCSAFFGIGVPLYAIIVGEFMMVLESKDSDQVLTETKMIAVSFIALSIFVSLSSSLSSFVFSLVSAKLTRKFKSSSLKSLLSQDLLWFDVENNSPESLKKTIFSEANFASELITERISSFCQALGTITACISISLYLDWKMGLVSLFLMPFILYRSVLVHRASNDYEISTSKVPKRIIRSMRKSSCLQHQGRFKTIFQTILRDEVSLKEGSLQIKGQAWGVIQCIPVLSYGVVFLFGSYFIQEHSLHYADLFKIVEGVIFGSILVSEGVVFSSKWHQLKTSVGHLFHVIDSDSNSSDVYGSKSFTSITGGSFPNACHGSLEFSCVEYRSSCEPYDDLLQSLSLKIPAGSQVALIDADGDARVKDAIAGILQRMLDLRHGIIFLDGHDITCLHVSWLRSQVAVIDSTPQLLTLSISDNISFGDNNRYIPSEEVIQAARICGIHDFIMSLPLGYHTVCHDNALNHEQRLRICIARALIRNPAVLIIGDILSGVEESSLGSFLILLETVMRDRTVIYMPSLFGWSNSNRDDFRVVYLEKGTLIQEGFHTDLMAKKGPYFNIITASES